MIQFISGDFIKAARELDADGLIFSANSLIKRVKDGDRTVNELVMGAGAARRVRDYFGSYIPRQLAASISPSGEAGVRPDYHIAYVSIPFKGNPERRFTVVAFQVKRHFQNPADLDLITESAEWLHQWLATQPDKKYVMNLPGVNLGQLRQHEDEIKEILSSRLGKFDLIVCDI